MLWERGKQYVSPLLYDCSVRVCYHLGGPSWVHMSWVPQKLILIRTRKKCSWKLFPCIFPFFFFCISFLLSTLFCLWFHKHKEQCWSHSARPALLKLSKYTIYRHELDNQLNLTAMCKSYVSMVFPITSMTRLPWDQKKCLLTTKITEVTLQLSNWLVMLKRPFSTQDHFNHEHEALE